MTVPLDDEAPAVPGPGTVGSRAGEPRVGELSGGGHLGAEVGAPVRTVSVWNVANAFTALRIVLVPLFGWLLLQDSGNNWHWRSSAALAFAVAVLTDRLDGELARSRQLITDVGKIADPIADKALIGTALVGLSVLGELPWWVTALVLVREIGITLVRLLVIRHGVMPAGRGGKAKTALQALAIMIYLVPGSLAIDPVRMGVMGAAVVVTVVTGVEYAVQAVRLVAGSERTRVRRADRARRRR